MPPFHHGQPDVEAALLTDLIDALRIVRDRVSSERGFLKPVATLVPWLIIACLIVLIGESAAAQ